MPGWRDGEREGMDEFCISNSIDNLWNIPQ